VWLRLGSLGTTSVSPGASEDAFSIRVLPFCPPQWCWKDKVAGESEGRKDLEPLEVATAPPRFPESSQQAGSPRDWEDEVWKLLLGNSLHHKSHTVKNPFCG
jgi:hypothetical protein